MKCLSEELPEELVRMFITEYCSSPLNAPQSVLIQLLKEYWKDDQDKLFRHKLGQKYLEDLRLKDREEKLEVFK